LLSFLGPYNFVLRSGSCVTIKRMIERGY
jgi:hypothetical protein